MKYHPLLTRLYKKSFKHDIDTDKNNMEMDLFLKHINESYNDFDKEKKLLGRSIDISSREYIETIEKMNALQVTFIQTEKMAGIGQLAAGIAHEINNPLGYVQSNIETQKKYFEKLKKLYDINKSITKDIENLDLGTSENNHKMILEFIKKNKMDFVIEDFEEIYNEAIQGLYRIEKIVKSLLRFSRKGLHDEFVEYDINKGIQDTITIAFNEIKYCAKLIEKLNTVPHITVNQSEINQVLLNLLIIKEATEKGITTVNG